MPISPGKNETQSDWMGRCVPEMVNPAPGRPDKRPQQQAVAICMQIWRDSKKELQNSERAWCTLEVKHVAEEQRTITGIASTPDTDRLGDIVEPLGLEFQNPLPLLWQHKHDQPVGWATMDKPTEKGISFSAQVARVDDPGPLRDRINDVWQSVKAGLVRGVSIGFRTLEKSFMDGGGVRFIRSEIVEVSLVTVPANSSATISTIKSIDTASSIAPDQQNEAAAPALPVAPDIKGKAALPPGAAGSLKTQTRKVKIMPATIAETIAGFEAKRTTAQAVMKAIMDKANEESRTLDVAEKEEFDGHETEVQSINDHLLRLKKFEDQQKSAAVPVQGTDAASASESRGSLQRELKQSPAHIYMRPNCPPTAGFTRLCIALMAGKGNREDSLRYAKKRLDWQSTTPEVAQVLADDDAMYHLRAAAPAGTTYDSAWAGPLVYAQNLTTAFAEYLRPMTIIGRFGSLRRVPFNVRVPRATGGTSGSWVGEAAPKPVTSMSLDTITMTWAKAAAIVVLTEELVRFSNPAAEDMVRNDLAKAITQFVDRQFVDPSVAAVSGVSPASITNGISPITASGVNMAAFRADVKTLFNALLSVNQSLAGGYWIMTQQQGMSLSIAQNSLGQQIYPTISEQGGTLLGYPVIASENIPATGGSPADGYPLIFAIGPEILLADDGVVTIDASREASLQMDTTPDSPPTASTNMLSLWQLNMLGLRAERYITWLRRRTSAVAWIQNAKYAE